MSQITYFEEQLLEYPGRKVRKSQPRAFLNRCVNQGGGAILIPPRWAAREFCDPGLWIKARLCPEALTPAELKKLVRMFRNDEWWGFCLIVIATGSLLKKTGLPPFKEGISHAFASGEFMAMQDLIDADPDLVLGPDIVARSQEIMGYATALIVSKRFVNAGPIPFHFHFGTAPDGKEEVHDVIAQDNPSIPPWHNLCHAIGLDPESSDEDFLRCLQRWGQKGGNGVLDLAQWHRIPVGTGTFKCPPLLLHAPGAVATHECHFPKDQHGLVQDRFDEFADPALTPEMALGAAPEVDYPKGQRKDDWPYLMGKMDFDLNRRTDLMAAFFSPNAQADQFCDDGVNAFFSCHGACPGKLETAILRVEVKPGAKTTLRGLPSSGYCFLSQGKGRVAGLNLRLLNGLKFDGSIPREGAFLTHQLVTAGVPIENTGKEPFVVTIDLQKEVHLS